MILTPEMAENIRDWSDELLDAGEPALEENIREALTDLILGRTVVVRAADQGRKST